MPDISDEIYLTFLVSVAGTLLTTLVISILKNCRLLFILLWVAWIVFFVSVATRMLCDHEKVKIESESFGIPQMFAIAAKPPDSLSQDSTKVRCFEVLVEFLQDNRSLKGTVCLPDSLEAYRVEDNPLVEEVEAVRLRKKMEFKRLQDDGKRLWGFGAVDFGSPTQTILYSVDTSLIAIKLDSSQFQKRVDVNTREPFNVRLHSIVRLNGICAGPVGSPHEDCILLLGYDGDVYKAPKPERTLGEHDQKPVPIVAHRLMSLDNMVKHQLRIDDSTGSVTGVSRDILDDTVGLGWQSLSEVKGDFGFPSNETTLSLLAVNGLLNGWVMLRLKWSCDKEKYTIDSMVVGELNTDKSRIGWPEGATTFSVCGVPYFAMVNAAKGEVLFKPILNNRPARMLYLKYREGNNIVPRYLEGVAAVEDRDMVIVSDRDGRIHWHKGLEEFIGTDEEQGAWQTMELLTGSAVRHGQGIAYDSRRNGVWLAAENHFRFVDMNILSEKYCSRANCVEFLDEHLMPWTGVVAVLLTVVAVPLGWKRRRESRK